MEVAWVPWGGPPGQERRRERGEVIGTQLATRIFSSQKETQKRQQDKPRGLSPPLFSSIALAGAQGPKLCGAILQTGICGALCQF